MKPLEPINLYEDSDFLENIRLLSNKLNETIDRVNELSRIVGPQGVINPNSSVTLAPGFGTPTPKRFKDKYVSIGEWGPSKFAVIIDGFKTKAEADAVRDYLLNL